MTITILNQGGSVSSATVNVPENATVADALEEAGISPNGRSIRINKTTPGQLTTNLRDGDIITLTNKVEGGKK